MDVARSAVAGSNTAEGASVLTMSTWTTLSLVCSDERESFSKLGRDRSGLLWPRLWLAMSLHGL